VFTDVFKYPDKKSKAESPRYKNKYVFQVDNKIGRSKIISKKYEAAE